jgi:phosphate:Na+ symporter
MEKVIPSKEPIFTEHLDQRLLEEPHLALEAARISAQDEFIALLQHINFILGDETHGKKSNLALLQSALDKTHHYIDAINPKKEKDAKWKELIALIHLLDHAQRLHERCEEEEYRAILVQQSPDFHAEDQHLITTNNNIIDAISSKKFSDATKYARTNEKLITKSMLPYRNLIAEKMANDEINIPTGTKKLESARWLTRVSHHITRITYHLEKAVLYTAK